jgi:glutaminyl-peptide cyclotransferase
MLTRRLACLLLLSLAGAAPPVIAQSKSTPRYGVEVVRSYPHNPNSFTQGLLFRDGQLYESTGLEGRSSVLLVRLETGVAQQEEALPAQYFGEGIVDWDDKIIQLTWQHGVGFVRDRKTLALLSTFRYPGEGWGLARDAKRIIMSDGTSQLRFLDPATLKETGRLNITEQGRPVDKLNELEYIKGEIWANVWQSNEIVRIDPKSGRVTSRIDLSGLLKPEEAARADVLNGIAYDAKGNRIFVTGKLWPRLFEIRLKPAAARQP